MPTAMALDSAPRETRSRPSSVRSMKLIGRQRKSAVMPATTRMMPKPAKPTAARTNGLTSPAPPRQPPARVKLRRPSGSWLRPEAHRAPGVVDRDLAHALDVLLEEMPPEDVAIQIRIQLSSLGIDEPR